MAAKPIYKADKSKSGRFWSVHVGARYRASAVQDGQDLTWFWIASHADYDATV
jgi:hypothetical protein